MIERADRDRIVLVDLPAGQTRRRTAFAIALTLLGSAEVAAPFASVPLRQFEAFIPVSQTFILVNDLITSVLLIAQFVIVRWRAILVLDDGTLTNDVLLVCYAHGSRYGTSPHKFAYMPRAESARRAREANRSHSLGYGEDERQSDRRCGSART